MGKSPKLIRRWTGPLYYIAEVLDKNTYKLHKQEDHRPVKSLVHANRLKPYKDPDHRPTNPPAGLQQVHHDLDPEEIENMVEAEPEVVTENRDQPDVATPTQGKAMPQQPGQRTQPIAAPVPEIEKILKRTKDANGKWWYKVWYMDKARNPETLIEDLVPRDLRNKFHSECCADGRRKKRKRSRTC